MDNFRNSYGDTFEDRFGDTLGHFWGQFQFCNKQVLTGIFALNCFKDPSGRPRTIDNQSHKNKKGANV